MQADVLLTEAISYYYDEYSKAIHRNSITEDTQGFSSDKLIRWNCAFIYSMIFNREVTEILRNEPYDTIATRLDLEEYKTMFQCEFINIDKFIAMPSNNFIGWTYNELQERIVLYNSSFGNQQLNDILLQLLVRTQQTFTMSNSINYEIGFVVAASDGLVQIQCPFTFLNTLDESIEVQRNGVTMEFSATNPSVNKYDIVMPNLIVFKTTTPATAVGEIFRFKKTISL